MLAAFVSIAAGIGSLVGLGAWCLFNPEKLHRAPRRGEALGFAAYLISGAFMGALLFVAMVRFL